MLNSIVDKLNNRVVIAVMVGLFLLSLIRGILNK